MRAWLIMSVVLVTASPSMAAAAAPKIASPGRGLCSAQEVEVFACMTRKGLAYVCAVPPAGVRPEKAQHVAPVAMQYRFGRPGQISFTYPAVPVAPKGTFHFTHTAYSGGGEAHLGFENSGFQYVLYDRTVAGDWDSEGHRPVRFTTGLLVRKRGHLISNVKCLDRDASIRAPAYELEEEAFDADLVP